MILSKVSFKRIDHFKNVLEDVQAKEKKDVIRHFISVINAVLRITIKIII